MPTDARIRNAKPDDAEAIQRVARASWHAAYDSILGADAVDEKVDSWYAPEKLVGDDVEPDDRPFFVAVVEGDVVGFTEAVPHPSESRIARLYRIYVHPDHWSRGIGRSLLERVESSLDERGFDRLQVSVLAKNHDAVEFYEAAGFHRTETTYDDQFGGERYEYRTEI